MKKYKRVISNDTEEWCIAWKKNSDFENKHEKLGEF